MLLSSSLVPEFNILNANYIWENSWGIDASPSWRFPQDNSLQPSYIKLLSAYRTTSANISFPQILLSPYLIFQFEFILGQFYKVNAYEDKSYLSIHPSDFPLLSSYFNPYSAFGSPDRSNLSLSLQVSALSFPIGHYAQIFFLRSFCLRPFTVYIQDHSALQFWRSFDLLNSSKASLKGHLRQYHVHSFDI